MRTALRIILVVFALAVQTMTPAAMAVASHGAPNGFARGLVCLSSAPGSGKSRLPGPHDSGHATCLFCQVSCSGVAFLAAGPNETGMAPVQWTAMSWTVADCAVPAPLREPARQARAPPLSS
jgi:hypothetical protein